MYVDFSVCLKSYTKSISVLGFWQSLVDTGLESLPSLQQADDTLEHRCKNIFMIEHRKGRKQRNFSFTVDSNYLLSKRFSHFCCA